MIHLAHFIIPGKHAQVKILSYSTFWNGSVFPWSHICSTSVGRWNLPSFCCFFLWYPAIQETCPLASLQVVIQTPNLQVIWSTLIHTFNPSTNPLHRFLFPNQNILPSHSHVTGFRRPDRQLSLMSHWHRQVVGLRTLFGFLHFFVRLHTHAHLSCLHRWRRPQRTFLRQTQQSIGWRT